MTTPDNLSNEPTTASERATVRSAATSAEFAAGTRIDHYVIRERLGEGGFAVVYRAEQVEPVRRDVALKIIKLGMDTKQVIARFEAERQALAMMDHAGVARVFDAGAAETGRPYFVMEYVPGDPITDYCDRHRLTNRQRLDLFIQTCEAVQHAHQKGIIHRDIKPSNVLVTVRDGAAHVKVIDFGVAKATQQRLTEQTIFTEQGQLIGTPEYMSPEQAEMRALDIDTRSDIYSLGVLLYELLVGTLPFDSKSLREAGFGEIQRIIREEQPPKPSTRLSSLGDETTGIAQRHRSDPRTLLRDLRGDLDWITMRCLEKDRTRRYDTANGLAADIRMHLDDKPVSAGPPSAVYRVNKFIRRNRTALIALVAVLLGVSGVTWGLVIAVSARDAERVLQERVDNVVWKNRFTGASDDTLMYVIHVPMNGRTGVVFMSAYLVDRFTVVRAEGGNDPRLDLCKLALRPEGFTAMSPEEFLAMADGLSHRLCQGIRMPGGDEATTLNRIVRARETWGADFNRMTAIQLRDVIGGLEGDNVHPRLHGVDQIYREWRLASEPSNWWGRVAETVTPLRDATEDTEGEPPRLRFTSTDDRAIRVGTHTMAVREFRDILRSIAPGYGFYLEYVSPDGRAVEPPPWVVSEILKPLGFWQRIVREDALSRNDEAALADEAASDPDAAESEEAEAETAGAGGQP